MGVEHRALDAPVAVAGLARLLAVLELVEGLVTQAPDDPYFHELRGQILFENGKLAEQPYWESETTTDCDHISVLDFNGDSSNLSASFPVTFDDAAMTSASQMGGSISGASTIKIGTTTTTSGCINRQRLEPKVNIDSDSIIITISSTNHCLQDGSRQKILPPERLTLPILPRKKHSGSVL